MAPTPHANDKGDEQNDSMFDESRVETLLKLQGDFYERAKKSLANFRKDNAVRKSTKLYYNTKLAPFGKIVTDFEDNHRELISLVPTADQQSYSYFRNDHAELFEDAQIDFITAVQFEYESKFPDQPVHREENTASLHPNIKLPTVSIPTFSGAHTEWKTFYDMFRAIVHTNEKLPGSYKFQYLLGSLTGETRDIIAGFEVCDDDFVKAWKALCDVYNDKPMMFMHIMKRFSSLEHVNKEHPEHLRDLMKSTVACMKSLDSVGVDRMQVDPVFAYLLMRKLPADTVAFWEETRDRKQLPSVASLQSCVETRIRVASAIASARTDFSATAPAPREHRAETNHQYQQSNQSQLKRKKVNSYQSSSKMNSTTTSAAVPSTSSANSSGKKFNCPLCNGEGHPMRTCDAFLALSSADRRSTIAKLQYCANCLAYNHTEAKCRSSHTCFTCGERHHSLLHASGGASKSVNPNPRFAAHVIVPSAPTSTVNINSCNSQTEIISSSNILLATAIVNVLDVNGEVHSLRALIDQGSEANFVTESASLALQLPKTKIEAVISGIGASNSHAKHTTSFTLQSRHDSTFELTVEALVLGRITNTLPSKSFKAQRWQHIVDLSLADPSYHRSGYIDLVLGADILAQVIMKGVRIGTAGSPVAQQTRLGWILSGKISESSTHTTTVTSMHATSSIEALLEKFISVESVEDAVSMSNEEQWCEQFFVDTHRRDETGRFIVRLPFRWLFDTSAAPLGRSRAIAIKGLLQLERRFEQNPNLKKEYTAAINDHILSGRMQSTTSTEIESDGHVNSAYLPHHAVIKESSTSTKLRVVFDASRKTTSGQSLNDVLVVGPTIQSDIVTIIINWRFHRIAFTADVQKMYLQVKVDQRDFDKQRILWRNDPTEPIQEFALNRLTFGTSCAPFIAIRSVQQLADDERTKYPDAAIVMTNDAYVDDVISGGDDLPTVQNLQRDLSQMMSAGGFDLKKWASNVNEVLEQIPESDREVKLPVELNANDCIKALGLAWSTATDSLGFKSCLIPSSSKSFTKRTALSTVAKLFDPIGLIAPIIVIAKIFMKRLWAAGLAWDDILPADLHNEWLQYIEGLQHISEIKIPRWIRTSKNNSSVPLHGFCDASAMAYGAALYLRTVDSNNNIHVHLIASKSRVAPNKTLTIPRLELCGAYLLSQLLTSVRKGMRHVSIPSENIHLWCDSEIVCYWLRNNKPLKVFVENRVCKIREFTTDIRWRHVRTHENPADLVSRGVAPKDLVDNSLWWHGPAWLKTQPDEWPISRIDIEPPAPPKEVDLELRRIIQANVCDETNDMIYQFSTYNRLIRISALCKRFYMNCRRKTDRITGNITIEELKSIHRHWVLQTQSQNYYDEVQCLSQAIPQPIDSKSKLISLAPFVDGNGILRVKGRLENSTLPYDETHPIILPPNAHFTNLLIDRCHLRSMHGGTQLMTSLLRRQYWIVNSRNAIRHRIHKCIVCYKQRATTSHQLMGSLPSARVRRTHRPFLHTGVDYCGPYDLRASKGRGVKTYKGYIDGLTTDAFLAAFRRFVSRRGVPSDMYSDNGTNFLGAANDLGRQFSEMSRQNEKSIANKLTEEHIDWHFIPPGSPHFVGIWEAGVKSVKYHLRHIIGESKLTFEEMQTFLCQIEACLNSRPLCANSSDPNDFTALTPAHFLVKTDLLSLPEPSIVEVNPNRLNHWEQIQQMRQFFCKRWKDDYLSQLQQRPKWCREETNLKIGDMVLVQDDRLLSSRWPLGRVVNVHPGNDGLVRVVSVRTATGIYKRNVTKISRLPIEYESNAEAQPASEARIQSA